ncbi:hypothetical protein G6F22_017994 [Rhizopus arrhizus]|nr:hypothetical protein G6F22_017994 [Rhizopus arrhizus]
MGEACDEACAAQGPLARNGLIDALRFLARQAVLQALAVIGLAVERRIAARPVIGVIRLPLRGRCRRIAGVAGRRGPGPRIGILRGAAAHRVGFQPDQRGQHPCTGFQQRGSVSAREHPAAAQTRRQIAAQRLHQPGQAFFVGRGGQQQAAGGGKQPAVNRDPMALGGFAQPPAK